MLTTSLQEDGFMLIPQYPRNERGFLATDTLPYPAEICNDEAGVILIRAIERGENYYFSLTAGPSRDASDITCADQIAERRESIEFRLARETPWVRESLPRLTVPQDPESTYRERELATRFSGSNTSYETSSSIVSSLSAIEIYQHFSDQLISQQWTADQEPGSNNFTRGDWRLVTETGKLISGVLSVSLQGENTYRLEFSMSTQSDLFINEPGVPQRIPQ